MPNNVSKGGDNVEYIYLANSEKLAKKKNGQFVNFYCGSFVYKGDKSLEYISHGKGLAQKNGSLFDYQYNLTDHLGNVRNVLNASGTSIQSNDYYPFGLTHNAVNNFAKNKYLYNGKEAQDEAIGGTVFNMSDYGARHYDRVTGRWLVIDPLAEKSRRWSPYTYCYNNPLRFIDPDGMSTWVIKNEDDTYQVINGDLNDNDHNIYSKNEKGELIRGESIGVTTSITSFYNDSKDKETGEAYGWMGTINTNDSSGEKFLERIFTSTPPLGDYIAQAGNGEPLDFKSNNIPSNLEDPKKREEYYYRGTYVGDLRSGVTGKTYKTYTSARDVGNIAAGYVAGANGISWKETTVAFGAYQIKKNGLSLEGSSSRNAQAKGWNMAVNNNTRQKRANTFSNSLRKIFGF